MDGLLTFLIFAALFYVMMRFGCGAHMVHGHGHEESAAGSADKKHVDPVCGMEVPPTEGYGMMYEGRLYRFCSRNCMDKFEAEPDQFPGERKEKTS